MSYKPIPFLNSGNAGFGTTIPIAKVDILDTTSAGSGALSGSALNIAQTWNTTGTPTALSVNVTDLSSNSSSILMDLQVDGVSKLRVNKFGGLISTASSYLQNVLSWGSGSYFLRGDGLFQGSGFLVSGLHARLVSNGLELRNTVGINWKSGDVVTTSNDLSLFRDAANTLAQRNGLNPQEFRLYGTYSGTGGVDYERFFIKTNTATATQIGVAAGGTGSYRNLEFQTGGSTRMTITSGGNVGIGTTTPAHPLDVTGTARITNGIMSTYGNYAWGFGYHPSGPAIYGGAFASGDSRFITIRGSVTAKLFIQNNSGVNFVTFDAPAQSLGIGTTAPASRLTITGGDVEITDSTKGVILRSPNDTRYRITVDDTGALITTAVV